MFPEGSHHGFILCAIGTEHLQRVKSLFKKRNISAVDIRSKVNDAMRVLSPCSYPAANKIVKILLDTSHRKIIGVAAQQAVGFLILLP